ncbi:MAG: hypothetical protein HYW49_03090 [Deltaproteobacteria bacterium]|nr:hypothetical protein [Deltaproteobacteria bacterium]
MSAITYLKNAVEIIGDGIGNENGLCETGDNCLYTPNFGAYQGHDSSVNNKLYECAFSAAGGLQNIRIFGYDTNGY